MTAINIITKPDAIHVLTDGAFYSSEGILLEVGTKCFALPTLDMVLVGRGRKDFMPFFISELDKRASDFDSAIEESPGALQAVMSCIPILLLNREQQAGAFDPAFELWLMGYSRSRNAFETYILPTHDLHPGLLAWQMGRVEGSMICAPVPTAEACRLAGVPDDISIENFDPEIDGLRLLEIQRHVPSAPDQRRPEKVGCIVGALAQITTITREGVSSKILRRWPDRIGEPINRAASMATQSTS